MTSKLNEACFVTDDTMLSVDQALDILNERIEPVAGEETVPLRRALGRTLAEDVIAPRDVPQHNNAAVDGWAVYYGDLNTKDKTTLPIGGRIPAGHPLDKPARRGEAYRIFTGAPMPDGEDGGPETVFMQEDCEEKNGTVVLPDLSRGGIKKGANHRKAGEDIKKGAVALCKGALLRAQEIGHAAAMGRAELKVYRPIRAAVFSTGDEIVDPARGDLPAGAVFDSNRYTVMALLEEIGCAVTDLGILPDKLDDVQGALEKAAADHDVLVTSGGVSTGEEDHVRGAVDALGSINFWRLSIKPGRPIAFGFVKERAFVGLPGNPVAAMVTFMRLARPLILRMGGRAEVAPHIVKVASGFDFDRKKEGRREWIRATLEADGNGGLVVMRHPTTGSGILTSMVEADGLIELPEHLKAVKKGDMVDFLPFSEVAR